MSVLNSDGAQPSFNDYLDARQVDGLPADSKDLSSFDHPGDERPDSLTQRPRAILTRLSDVTPVPIRWLWPGFIAIGKLTLVVGDPGVGKSFLSLDLAARVSTGSEWPDGSSVEDGPASVILISAEDGYADTICPRLAAAGADMARVDIFEEPLNEEGKPESFSLRKHVPNLEWAIREKGNVRFVVIDPLTAFGGGVDDRSQGAVREMMKPLADMAERLGVAVLVISHLNKNEGGRAAYRTTGSLSYTAISRAVWLVIKDAEDGTRRLLLSIKNNLAMDSKGLAYRIVGGRLDWEPDPVGISADEAMAAETKARQQPGMLDRAIAFLKQNLAGGAMSMNRLCELGEAAGMSKRTLDRAKKEALIGDKKLKTDGGMRSFWHLPGMCPSSLDDCQLEDSGSDAEEAGGDACADEDEIPF